MGMKHGGDTVFLGSKLDTAKDINRRKGLASAAWKKYQLLLTSKNLPLLTRVRYLETFVGSIFLHQCGIWTLTKKLESSVDVFQRLFLRRVVGIRYPKNITNQELYKITKQIPWSETCKKRRLTLFGHTNRLPYGAPSREALLECLKPIKRPVGGQKLTLIKLIRNDFNTVGETRESSLQISSNKKDYQKLVRSVMSSTSETQQRGQ